jgi:NADH-quinone oxidoreductase subunit J
MEISPIPFFIFAVIAIACSLLVVLKKNPVASAFSLILVFFCFSGIYAILGAHLVAALQILVYAGAIMVLFVFVIMLLNADIPSLDLARSSQVFRGVAGVLTLVLFGFFVKIFKSVGEPAIQGPHTAQAIEAAGGNTRVLSELMFSDYLLPFELTSVLLLAGIVAAVAIAKRRNEKEIKP